MNRTTCFLKKQTFKLKYLFCQSYWLTSKYLGTEISPSVEENNIPGYMVFLGHRLSWHKIGCEHEKFKSIVIKNDKTRW